jgi:hypothetical protein
VQQIAAQFALRAALGAAAVEALAWTRVQVHASTSEDVFDIGRRALRAGANQHFKAERCEDCADGGDSHAALSCLDFRDHLLALSSQVGELALIKALTPAHASNVMSQLLWRASEGGRHGASQIMS